MMACHVRNAEPGRALELFVALYGELFAHKVLPNAHSFSSLLKACVALRLLSVASQLHSLIVKLLDEGSEDCIFVWNALIDVHAKLGALSDAEKVFHGMRYKNISSWNIMMSGYSRHKLSDRALDLSKSMTRKDAFSWNIIISCLWEGRRGEDALRLFIHLVSLEGHGDGNGTRKPCVSTYTTVLHICSVLALLVFGRQVHARTMKNSLFGSSTFLCSSLISMYSSCGMTQDLQQVFDETTVRDTVSWNSVIQGLGQNGLGKQALLVAERALELKMYNGNTFIAMLTSCSHAGLVAEGLGYFDSMTEKYGVERTLDHYINAIDLLGRAGRLEEAHALLQNMPFAPTVTAWSTLLHSCLAHKNSLVGSIAARELKALQRDGSENYERLVLGCRGGGEVTEAPFGVAGDVKSAAHIPGCSWVT
jgi:pentatricopeptide repeat protein